MIEDALTGIQAYIAANLTTRLNAIATARSVTIPRAASADILVGFCQSKQYPNISIVPAPTDFEYSDPESPYILPLQLHGVSIIVDHNDVDETEAMLVLVRYSEAITQMVIDDWTCGDRFNKTQLVNIEPGIFVAHDDKSISQSIDITIAVRILSTQS